MRSFIAILTILSMFVLTACQHPNNPSINSTYDYDAISTYSNVPNSTYYSGDALYNRPVYVKGYYRKDGTYVHSYTRSRPTRRK